MAGIVSTAVTAPQLLGWACVRLRAPWNVQVAALDATTVVVDRLTPRMLSALPWTELTAAWASTLREARYPSVRTALLRLFMAAIKREQAGTYALRCSRRTWRAASRSRSGGREVQALATDSRFTLVLADGRRTVTGLLGDVQLPLSVAAAARDACLAIPAESAGEVVDLATQLRRLLPTPP